MIKRTFIKSPSLLVRIRSDKKSLGGARRGSKVKLGIKRGYITKAREKLMWYQYGSLVTLLIYSTTRWSFSSTQCFYHVATRFDFQAGRGRAKLRNDIPLEAAVALVAFGDRREERRGQLIWREREREREREKEEAVTATDDQVDDNAVAQNGCYHKD